MNDLEKYEQILRTAARVMEARAKAANTERARLPYGDERLPVVSEDRWGGLVDTYLGGAIGAHCGALTPAVVSDIAEWLTETAEEILAAPAWADDAWIERNYGGELRIARRYLDAVAAMRAMNGRAGRGAGVDESGSRGFVILASGRVDEIDPDDRVYRWSALGLYDELVYAGYATNSEPESPAFDGCIDLRTDGTTVTVFTTGLDPHSHVLPDDVAEVFLRWYRANIERTTDNH